MLLVLPSRAIPNLLINRSLVGNRKLKNLAQDVKDDVDEPVSELAEHEA